MTVEPVLRVLLIEDSAADARLIETVLQKKWGDGVVIDHARRLGDAFARLGAVEPDVVLLDLNLPDADAPDTLRRLGAMARLYPIIALSGDAAPETIELVAAEGVQEFVLKDDLVFGELLSARIQIARERARWRASMESKALTEAERRLTTHRLRILHIEDRDSDHVMVERVLRKDLAIPFDLTRESRAETALEALAADPPDLILLDLHLPDGQGMDLVDSVCARAGDAPVVVVSGTLEEASTGIAAVRAGTQDFVTKEEACLPGLLARTIRFALTRHAVYDTLRNQARSLEDARESLHDVSRLLAEVSPVGIFRADRAGEVVYANDRFHVMTGLDGVEALGRGWLAALHPEDAAAVEEGWNAAVAAAGSFQSEWRFDRPESGVCWVLAQTTPERGSDGAVTGHLGAFTDITERRELEGLLLQAQKMEGIGQLAGGIAHDFNNLLTGILGFAELGTRDAAEPAHSYFTQIQRAGEQAATLTRQLLAFSRKQQLQPRILELDALVGQQQKMLARVIGENLRLVFVAGSEHGRVKVDPTQLEQVVMNLVVNARDSMGHGGVLTIETAKVDLDEQYAALHRDVSPGPHVLLAITDTGSGIDAATLERIFEPFFTTKDEGRGTGLGLATVHGIVKQSGGHITVYSEPGRGTTFRIYLPQVEERLTASEAQETPNELDLRGDETILVVEDEEVVRDLARLALEESGYRVIEAVDGAEAIRAFQENADAIDLVLSDVILPVGSGGEVAEFARRLQPGIRIIYMSGYTANSILNQGVVDPNVIFLPKPITPLALLRKVRGLLDAPAAPDPDALERAADPPTGTVLVVDDSLTVRGFAREVLESAGLTVLDAEDGEIALALAEEHDGAIDVLLTDVLMPGMKGPELAGRLLARRPDVAVLFMSGYTAETAGLAGADFISKPPTPNVLVSRVRAKLSAKG